MTTKPKQPKKTSNPLDELEHLLNHELETDRDLPEQKHKRGKAMLDEESTILADMIGKKHHQRKVRLIVGGILSVLLVIGAAIGSIWYYNVKNPPSQENVAVTIEGPDKVTVGEEVTYTIAYTNKGDVDIKNAKLIFREPHGFTILSTNPTVNGRSWDIGDVLAGQRGEVTLSGTIVDSPDVEQKMVATMLYIPANFNSEFSKETTLAIGLQPPSLAIEPTVPPSVTLGEKVTFLLSLKNTNLYALPDVKLHLTYPKGFTVSYTDIAPLQDKTDWRFTNLAPAGEQKLKIEGSFDPTMTFAAEDERNQPFEIEIQYPNKTGDYFPQLHSTAVIKIVDQPITTQLIINGSANTKNVNLGDTLTATIAYKNNGAQTYKNVTLRATIKSTPDQVLDWKAIKDDEFGKIDNTDAGRTITWTKEQIEALAELKPKAEGTIVFSIPVKQFADLKDIPVADIGKNSVEAFASMVLTDDKGTVLPTIDSSHVQININSNVQLSTKALYYYEDGTPIGNGPLPPKVGQTTSYVIFMELQNTLHELENIRVSATLPDGIAWIDAKPLVSSGEANYTEATKTMEWTLNRLPTSATKASLTFHIALTPQTTDAGKLMKLLNTTTITAHDTVTADDITITKSVLTTNLDEDEFGIGKGIVTQ